jgi:hypothetical protein
LVYRKKEYLEQKQDAPTALARDKNHHHGITIAMQHQQKSLTELYL